MRHDPFLAKVFASKAESIYEFFFFPHTRKFSMTQYSSQLEQSGDGVAMRILGHFRSNPFRFHFMAWLIAAVPFGLLMMPEFSVPSALGFGISAIVFCTITCITTYPLSGHFSFTIVGVLFGAAMVPIGVQLGLFGSSSNQALQLCIFIGGIIGSTSTIWQIPLKVLQVIGSTDTRGQVQ